MDYNSQFGYEDFRKNDQQRLLEKREIKSRANMIGAALMIVWSAPSIIYRSIAAVANLFGLTSFLGALFADPAFVLIFSTVISILIFTLPFLIIPKTSGEKIGKLIPFAKPNKKMFMPTVLIGVGFFAFANIATNTLSNFFANFGINFVSPNYDLPKGVFGFALSILAMAVTPALVEEFSMRGAVMGSAKKFGEEFAVISSAIIFALIHGNFVQIPFAFIMGLVIGWAVIKTGSIWTGISIHFINNAVSVALDRINDSISSVIVQSGIAIYYFAVCILFFFIGLYLIKKEGADAWKLQKQPSSLDLSEKLKVFFTSPVIIVFIVFTAIECLEMIKFG